MLTAANRTTKKSQEILSTGGGELMVAPAECEAALVEGTTVIPTGPCRLVGVILISGTYESVVSIESDTYMKLKIRAGANLSSSVMLTQPVSCPADLGVSLYGTGAEAIIYYSPI